jgi:hypothetical protein
VDDKHAQKGVPFVCGRYFRCFVLRGDLAWKTFVLTLDLPILVYKQKVEPLLFYFHICLALNSAQSLLFFFFGRKINNIGC